MANETKSVDESKCLFHYGKKGMKWGKHKYTAIKNGQYVYGNLKDYVGYRSTPEQKHLYIKTENPKKVKYPHNVGVGIYKNNKGETSLFVNNTRNSKYWDEGEKYTKIKKGPFSAEYAEDGATYYMTVKKKSKTRTKKIKTDHINKGKQKAKKIIDNAKKKKSVIKSYTDNFKKSYQKGYQMGYDLMKKKKK